MEEFESKISFENYSKILKKDALYQVMLWLTAEIFTIKNVLFQKNIVSETEIEKIYKVASQVLEESADETIKQKYDEMISEKIDRM